jgi:hypothetical protein
MEDRCEALSKDPEKEGAKDDRWADQVEAHAMEEAGWGKGPQRAQQRDPAL